MNDEMQDDLQVMLDKVSDLYSSTQYLTTLRLAEEAHRKAKSEKELIHLLNANFYIMNSANSSMRYQRAVEACLETIPLLESEEEASKLQPDFEASDYYQHQWWLSACTYDNLATATAALQGNNADGLHQCIADGISVCQRTGKTQCITCFREYATEVFLASDDLEMARKHAEINANKKTGESKERVWVSTRDLIGMAMLEGNYESARRLFDKAPSEIGDYYNSEKAKSDCYTKLEEFKLMLGELSSEDEMTKSRSQTPELRAADENPRAKFELDKNDALQQALQGDYENAAKSLSLWDRELLGKSHLKDWFDVRLRILAILFKSEPQGKRFEKLSKQLLEKARAANDWLTVRRFNCLANGSVEWTPLALIGTPTLGLFAHDGDPQNVDVSRESQVKQPGQQPEPEKLPMDFGEDSELARALDSIQPRFIELLASEYQDKSEAESIWQELLNLDTATAPAPQVGRLLYLADGLSWHVESPWTKFQWLQLKLEEFPDDARILSLAANLADTFIELHEKAIDNEENDALPKELDFDWVGLQHENAIKISGDLASVFSRAGGFYFRRGNLDKAERYLARASRLDRTDAFAALKLSEIYADSDRQLDALNVLDLCIRSGCEDSEVIWAAVMAAKTLGKYEELLTYAARFDELVEDYPWSCYYSADALLELKRYEEAHEKAKQLAELDDSVPLATLSMQAMSLKHMGRTEEANKLVRTCINLKFSDSVQMSPPGALAAVDRLFNSISEESGLRTELANRFAPGGFLPEEYFETLVDEESASCKVRFFVIVMMQTLGPNWSDAMNAFPFQFEWQTASQNYGVIAEDGDQAAKIAQEFHAMHWPSGCSVEAVNETDHEYHDRPRIVWNSQLYQS